MKIFVGGDFCPENNAESKLINGDNILHEDFQVVWNDCDFRILNLEGPITDSKTKILKVGRHIKFHPSIINGLTRMGVDYFSLSNNHIMDYGKSGIVDTIKLFDDNGIGHFGSHHNKYALLEKDNQKVAIVSFTNKEFSLANDFDGYGVYGIDIIDILETFQEIKAITSNIIVLLHTGLSKFPFPSPNQRKICKFLIKNGAKAVLCQHSHIVGAYEILDEKLICYGQGSFVFDLNRKNSTWNKGYSIILDFDDNDIKYSIIPHKQFDDVDMVRLLNEEELKDFLSELDQMNCILNSDKELSEAWMKYIDKNEKQYFNQYFLPKNRILKKVLNKVDFSKIIHSNIQTIMLNNFRNEEHSEVMIELLKKKINKKYI